MMACWDTGWKWRCSPWARVLWSFGLWFAWGIGAPKASDLAVPYARLVGEARSFCARPWVASRKQGAQEVGGTLHWVSLARLPHSAHGTLSCALGHRPMIAVTMIDKGQPHTWRCAAVGLRGSGPRGAAPDLFELQGSTFCAIPVGAAAGVQALAFWGGRGARSTFRHVWIASRGRTWLVSALLVGDVASGAYRFTIRGQKTIRMIVKATLFFRHRPPRVWGIPALASLYDYGISNHMPVQALYPARHKSDGLWVQTPKTAYWAPLRNPRAAFCMRFFLSTVRAFGLLQRDRTARYYGTQRARYQDASNAWVRIPKGLQGHVVLREWPTKAGHYDNIVASFVPMVRPLAHKAWTVSYQLIWTRQNPTQASVAAVVSTLIGGDAPTGARKYVIDYAGGPLPALGAHASIAGEVQVRPDTFVAQNTVRFNPYTGGWRQVIQVLPLADHNLHVKAWLTLHHHLLSEFWEYDILRPRISH